jgi:O-acetylserine/cysteine efflux transporter
MSARMPISHVILALVVVAVWGTNFVVIKVALEELPPLLFACLRFSLAFLPAAFFLRRPDVPWRILAGYGLAIGVGQFGLLFIAMERDITPGLASVVVQMQVFFTIGLFMWRAGERLRGFQILALLLGLSGIAVIAFNTDAATTPLGIALTLGAALSWAFGNLAGRAAGGVNMLAFVVWSSLFAVPPLLLLSLGLEGWPQISASVASASAGAWAAVAWQAAGNSLFGYGIWAWLHQRHAAAQVSPMALLVPLFGIGASVILLGEPFPLWKAAAAALIVAGLAIGVLWPILSGPRAEKRR